MVGVWTGYQNPSRLRNTNASKSVFQSLMGAYLNTKQLKQFTTDSNVTSAVYCTQSGNLAGPGCPTATGWYEKNNMPSQCTQHQNTTSSSSEEEEEETSSNASSSESSSSSSSSSGSSSSASSSSSSPAA